MRFDDEEGADDASGRTPPAPDDRLWRHPSELARATAPTPPPSHDGAPSRRTVGLALAGACLTGAALACGALWLVRPDWAREPVATTAPATFTSAPTPEYASAGVPVQQLAAEVAPDLVEVSATSGATTSGATTSGATAVTGTGLWIDAGQVLVVLPVVEGATALAVTDHEQRRSAARLAGSDAPTEAAVLTVDDQRTDHDLPLASAARSGQAVAIIGARSSSSGGHDQRVVPGTVSAIGVRTTLGDVAIHDGIQLDRTLPADALGAVVADADGNLVGLVVDVSDTDGLALALPARDVLAAARQLAATGEVRRAWLGVRPVDASPDAPTGAEVDGGATVTSVQPGSPAAAGGLEAGDTVTGVGGAEVHDSSDLVLAIRRSRPGDVVEVTWWRGGHRHQRDVTLGG